jgi:hypothetical protein
MDYTPQTELEKILIKYLDKPWDYISENPNITMDFFEKYPDKLWNWNYISANIWINNDELDEMNELF